MAVGEGIEVVGVGVTERLDEEDMVDILQGS